MSIEAVVGVVLVVAVLAFFVLRKKKTPSGSGSVGRPGGATDKRQEK